MTKNMGEFSPFPLPQEQLPPTIVSIRELCTDRNRYAVFPAFQRQQVWSIRDEQALIDTILLGDPLPPFEGYIYYTEQGESIYGMIDGHQRISAILDFRDGKFKTWTAARKRLVEPNSDPPVVPNCWYTNLDPIAKNCFLDYRLQINNVRKRSDKQISTRFLRIQNQVPLTPAERINACASKAKQAARRIEEHGFWDDFYYGKTNREQKLETSMHLLALELVNKETVRLNSRTFISSLSAGDRDDDITDTVVNAVLARLTSVEHVYYGSQITVRAAIVVMYQSVQLIERMGYIIQPQDKGKLTAWLETVISESSHASTMPRYNQPIHLILSEKRQELFWKLHTPTILALFNLKSSDLWSA
jgi:Protein of unknown function DUF262